MWHNTRAIALRNIRYGDTSLIVTLFTEDFGMQSYLVQGVRKTSKGGHKAGLLQPATLLHIVSDQRPFKNLLRLKEYSAVQVYSQLSQSVVRNCVALFAVELLYRLLQEHAPMKDLFGFCFHFFEHLDELEDERQLANYPLYFATRVGAYAGYDLYDTTTGILSEELQVIDDARKALQALIKINHLDHLPNIIIAAELRRQLLHAYLQFLQVHAQHLGSLKSLPVVEAVLHG